jgi:mono/diheme cytochrome c family protein
MKRRIAGLVALWTVGGFVPPSTAQTVQSVEKQGELIADQLCASCHAIGREGASAEPKAPPFRDLHKRYPVEQLAESLAEGIFTGHEMMPEFTLEPAQIEAFLAYLESLNR